MQNNNAKKKLKITPKYKICFLLREDIWNNRKKFRKLKKKKWIQFKKKNYNLMNSKLFVYFSKIFSRNRKKLIFAERNQFLDQDKKKRVRLLRFTKFARLYYNKKKTKKIFDSIKKNLLSSQTYLRGRIIFRKLFEIKKNVKNAFKIFYGRIKLFHLKNIKQNIKNKKKKEKNFISTLEQRLDTLTYRSLLSKSILHGRQMVLHGKIAVNEKVVTSPNFIVKPGDIISINVKTYREWFRLIKQMKRRIFIKKYKQKKYNFMSRSHLAVRRHIYSSLYKFDKYTRIRFLKKRIYYKQVIFPKYLQFNFHTFSTMLIRKPKISEINLVRSMNPSFVYRALN